MYDFSTICRTSPFFPASSVANFYIHIHLLEIEFLKWTNIIEQVWSLEREWNLPILRLSQSKKQCSLKELSLKSLENFQWQKFNDSIADSKIQSVVKSVFKVSNNCDSAWMPIFNVGRINGDVLAVNFGFSTSLYLDVNQLRDADLLRNLYRLSN